MKERGGGKEEVKQAEKGKQTHPGYCDKEWPTQKPAMPRLLACLSFVFKPAELSSTYQKNKEPNNFKTDILS